MRVLKIYYVTMPKYNKRYTYNIYSEYKTRCETFDISIKTRVRIKKIIEIIKVCLN